MAIQHNDQIDNYTGDINTAPDKYTVLTGTLTSVGRIVTGVGTLFMSEIASGLSQIGSPSTTKPNGWIFNGSNEVAQIKDVVNNTTLVLDEAFTADISISQTVKFVKPSRVNQMSLVAVAAGAIVNGVTLSANEATGWGYTASQNVKTCDPIVIDSQSAAVHVTKMYAN